MDLTTMRNLTLQYLDLGGVATDRVGSPIINDALNRAYKRLSARLRFFFKRETGVAIAADGTFSLPAHWAEVTNVVVTSLAYPLGKAGSIRQFDFINPMWRDASGAPTDYAPLDGDTYQVCPPPTASYQDATLEGYAIPDGTTIALLAAGTDTPAFSDDLHEALVYDAVADLCRGLLVADPAANARAQWAEAERDKVLAAKRS